MSKSNTYTAGCSAVGGYSYAGNFTLYVTLTDRDGSSSSNQSYVDYNVYCQSSGSGSISAKHYLYFSINGEEKRNETVSVSASSPNAYIYITSGTITVSHDNDGTKSIPFSAQIKASSYGVSASTSGTFTLEQIPRYAAITSYSIGRRDETSVVFYYTTDADTNYAAYSKDNGSTWSDLPVSGIVTGLSVGTTYNFKLRVRRTDSGLITESGTYTQSTYSYPYITNVGTANLSIGSSQTLTIYNPLSRSITVKMNKDTASGTQLYSGTTTGTSLTFTPTASTLYASIPSSTSGKAVYSVVYSSTTKSTTGNYTYNVVESDCVPTFSNFTYADTNSTTVALTGSNQILVSGYSNVTGTISEANKATAKNNATMSNYKMVIGTASNNNISYVSSGSTSGTINQVASGTIVMYAVDSRGLTTAVTKTATLKAYTDLTIKSVTATRSNNGIGEDVTLAFNGTLWNASFGSVTNTITTVTYQYKETSASSWTTGTTTLSATISGSNYSGSFSIKGDLVSSGGTGFDASKTFNIMLTVGDKLSTKTYTVTLGAGAPAIAIYKSNVAIGQKYDTSEGSRIQVNGGANITGAVKIGGNVSSNYLPNAGTPTAGTSFSNVSSGQDFYRSGLFSFYAENNWYNVINIRHRNGHNDGIYYGMQFRSRLTSQNTPLELRKQAGQSAGWTDWETIFRAKALYNNTTGTSGTVTLSETAANFSYLEIYFYGGDTANMSSVKIHSPNGKGVALSVWIASQGTSTMEGGAAIRRISISGTSITTNSEYYSYIGITDKAISANSHSNNITIVKVVGYR